MRDENIKFKMLGFKAYDSTLKAEIKNLLKNKVELIDFQTRTKDGQPHSFVQELSKSAVLVIPRYYDTKIPRYCDPNYVRSTFGWLPTKFAEYISMGRPVIVTTLDISSEFVEKYDCGFVCDPTPESIAETILKARETPSSELNKKGVNGRKLAEKEFDIQVIVKRYLNLLCSHLIVIFFFNCWGFIFKVMS